jgi:competence ComEA-like helix-hairpin-helix protein
MAATTNEGNMQSTGVLANSAEISRIAVRDTGVSGSSLLADTSRSVEQNPSKFQLLNLLMGILLVILLAEWCWIVTRRPTPILIQRGDDFRRAFRVEINSATWVEWMQLEGIGPALANRIVADRQVNGPFVSIEDLERVPGIGSGTLDRLRPSLILRHEQKTAQRNNQ